MLNVSVVIPTYNCQRYIAEAIESVLENTTESALANNLDRDLDSPAGDRILEVIVVDDGSTDETKAVVNSIDHPKLRYLYQHNQGVSAARNHGIYEAKGDLIAFLDADDVFLPNKLIQQQQMFVAEPALGLVQSGWQKVDEAGNLLTPVKLWESVPDLSTETWLKFKPVLPSALMIRREWLLKVDGFDPQLRAAEDVDLVSRLACNGCQSAWLKTVAVNYRQRSDSAMGNAFTQAEDLGKFLDKFFQQPELPESIQLLESSVRYNTLVWSAWYFLHTNHTKEMVDQLKNAWQYSPYLPLEALIHWSESFSIFSNDWGKPLDMKALIDSKEWQQLVQWLLSQR